MRPRNAALFAMLLAALPACNSNSKSTPSAAPPAPPTPTAGPTPPTPAVPPTPAGPAAPAPLAAPSGALTFTPDPTWIVETSTSTMRKAQYKLPRSEGDAQDASLVVYYFGGQGGSIAANLERWAGQFEQPDGRASATILKKSERTVNGLKVTDADLSGTYVAETAPGSGVRVREENWRMLAAIVESADGPYYVKLVGPAATIARWEQGFRSCVDSARARG